jgi:hypothetical protein
MSSTSKNNEYAKVNWQEKAACKALPLEVFFPEESHQSSPKVYDQARSFCNSCDVSAQCLAFAMHHERYQWRRFGMFGGHSPRERTNLNSANPYRDWVSEFLNK